MKRGAVFHRYSVFFSIPMREIGAPATEPRSSSVIEHAYAPHTMTRAYSILSARKTPFAAVHKICASHVDNHVDEGLMTPGQAPYDRLLNL